MNETGRPGSIPTLGVLKSANMRDEKVFLFFPFDADQIPVERQRIEFRFQDKLVKAGVRFQPMPGMSGAGAAHYGFAVFRCVSGSAVASVG